MLRDSDKDLETATRQTCWWAGQDSNLQPDRYERPALTIELPARRRTRPVERPCLRTSLRDAQRTAARRSVRPVRSLSPHQRVGTKQRRPASRCVVSASAFSRTDRQSAAKNLLGRGAFALLIASVVALFSISASLLDHFGYHYETSGGLPWEKFHPGTILAVLAVAARIVSADHPSRTAGRIFGRDTALLVCLAAVGVAAAHALLVSGYPFTALVDTFVLPVLVIILLTDLRPAHRRRLALVVCGLMAANALVALAEYLLGWRLVPLPPPPYDPLQPDPDGGNLEWRATALLGHPLENAIVTGSAILCLASRAANWLAPAIRFPLLILSLAALVAFGGRAALVLTLLMLAMIVAFHAARHLASGKAVSSRAVALVLLAFLAVSAVAAAVLSSGFLDRFIERFSDDAGSANARIVMWDMFRPFSWTDILLGPDPGVMQLQQHLLGIELGIESFWVALTLTYGLIVACVLFCALAIIAWRLVVLRGPGAGVVLLLYFAVASTSTSLSSKTTGLALVTALILLWLEPVAAAGGRRPG